MSAKEEVREFYSQLTDDQFDKLLTIGNQLISKISTGIDRDYDETEQMAIEIASAVDLLSEAT